MSTPIAILTGICAGILQASFFEWVYHRYWLHRPWLPPQMFTAHTLVHHQLCKHDDTYHVHEEEQEEALTFQWWAGPVLVGINLLPYLAAWWALVRGSRSCTRARWWPGSLPSTSSTTSPTRDSTS